MAPTAETCYLCTHCGLRGDDRSEGNTVYEVHAARALTGQFRPVLCTDCWAMAVEAHPQCSSDMVGWTSYPCPNLAVETHTAPFPGGRPRTTPVCVQCADDLRSMGRWDGSGGDA